MRSRERGRPIGLFVTGTDTGVGKTRVACALLRAFAARGLRSVGMKPVAAGTDAAGISEDVSALMAAANVAARPELVNPYTFPEPIAPHLAAARRGVAIRVDTIAGAYRDLAGRSDVVVVEGAGGALVPLDGTADMLDIAAALELPVLLVVGMRLGCLNHALLAALAVRSRGLVLRAFVANRIDPAMAVADENVRELCARMGAPLLADLAHGQTDLAGASLDLLCDK